jgi:hypothetical protein
MKCYAKTMIVRVLIIATCICLSACARPGEPASTDLSSNPNSIEMTREAQEINKPKERESCTKLSELKIGMTMSQALLSCERKPLRVTEAIIRGGKKEINWAYWGSYLHFVDGKLTSVQDLHEYHQPYAVIGKPMFDPLWFKSGHEIRFKVGPLFPFV